jgi:3',5'-cyclic AMP phosphodiesterase CpdA
MRCAGWLCACALALAGCGSDANRDRAPTGGGPGGSTLRSTLVDEDRDGFLEPGPAEPFVERAELAPPARPGRTLATLGQLSDLQLPDEESPARVPFLDRFGGSVSPSFRPQEALAPQVATAAVRAMNSQRPDAVAVTGDLLDNAQRNELAQVQAVLAGGTVRPDTGAPGYEGVQAASNPDPLYYRPDLDAPRHAGLLAAAGRPFASPGLRAPWFAAVGNHDISRQGELPPSPRTDAVATGTELTTSLDPDFRLDEAEDSSLAVDRLLDAGIPGTAVQVAPDPARASLSSREVVAAFARGREPRSPDRLDYVVDVGPALRAVVLDTADRAGGARGRVEPEQVAWLREQLAVAGDRDVIVISHNRLESSTGGEPAVAVLAAAPNVIANLSGNVHRNRIRARPRPPGGGYWVIETSSVADFPQQGRMLRLRETAGGGRVLETWTVDQDGRGSAGVARELAYLDSQGGRPEGRAGARPDRNARLYLPARATG